MNLRPRICSSIVALMLASTTFSQVLPSEPFAGVNLAKLSADQRRTITEASEDFQAVVAGRSPPHASHDFFKAHPSDGGTSFYSGHNYKLTIEKSLSSFGGLNGYVYGPIIVFDQAFAPGNESRLSSLRFYTEAQMGQLLAK